MQRFTISLDDNLAERFDELIARRRYSNRSKAFRDLLLEMFKAEDFALDADAPCVALVSYSYSHRERQLSMRLTEHQHQHTEMVISSMHVHVSHDECAETVVIRGHYGEVRRLCDEIIASPGIRHGKANIMPVQADEDEHHHHHHD